MGLTAELAEATMAEFVFQSTAELVGLAHQATGSSVLAATALVVHQPLSLEAMRVAVVGLVAPATRTRILRNLPRKA